MNNKYIERVPRNQKRNILVVFLLMAFLVSMAPAALPTASSAELAYVDSTLLDVSDETVSVIVSAVDSETAVAAVEQFGGEVTSDLWLIDAVGATISVNHLDQLAVFPGIVSIVKNNAMGTADHWDGWVTNHRVKKGNYPLEDKQLTSVVKLPDGGFLSISEKGKILIINTDGSERARINLSSGSPFYLAPTIDSAGTIYIAGEGKRVFAFDANGAVLWLFQSQEKLKGSVALSPDERTVYVADEKRTVYALDSANGQELWQFKVDRIDGDVKAAPTVAADGMVYVVSTKGYLAAIDATGAVKWSFAANDGGDHLLSPLVSNNHVFIAGEDKFVSAVNIADGSLAFQFQTDSKILAQPALATDGSLFITAEDRTLYGLNPDGSLRFTFRPSSGKFKTSPVLAANEQIVYAAIEENILYAVDATSGNEQWQYSMLGKILASPTVDTKGNVMLGSEGMDFVILNAGGAVVFQEMMPDAMPQSPIINETGDITILTGDSSLIMLGMLPDAWDGRPDVLTTGDKKVFELVTPLTVDLGVDVLHNSQITGDGVTVAVIDSGIYFDKDVRQELGTQVNKLFWGQADFVNIECPTVQITRKKTAIVGTQYSDHCFQDSLHSLDDYGHGTHVAGIMWNQFTDLNSATTMGIAPGANLLSVRVLGEDGIGSYETVIKGIQYVVENKDVFNVRVMNLSLSGNATTPYFVDPLNRAVEAAWANGIAVLAAAGNSGPGAESITVPGNDPYVITVGAVDSKRTPGYWADDIIPTWSASGPTLDGFVKPDVLAPGGNIVSFMYNDPTDPEHTAALALMHPDYTETASLFRMNGTSMATAVASGVVALMLEANPDLTPDEVKYRLMYSARTAVSENNELGFSPLQQGAGRIWAPDAVLGTDFLDGVTANAGMDVNNDLAHDWVMRDANGDPIFDEQGIPLLNEAELGHHYQGPLQRVISDDGLAYLYYYENPNDGSLIVLGAAWVSDMTWMDQASLASADLTFDTVDLNGTLWPHADTWSSGVYSWGGGVYSWGGGVYSWGGGVYSWGGGVYSWGGGVYSWGGGVYSWGGGVYSWGGGVYSWGGGVYSWGGGVYSWGGGIDQQAAEVSSTTWIDDE